MFEKGKEVQKNAIDISNMFESDGCISVAATVLYIHLCVYVFLIDFSIC